MEVEWGSLAVSAVFAHIGTNLDNLLALVAVLPGLGRARGVGVFLTAQAIVLTIAWGLAEGAEQIVGSAVGWLGLVPLGLGLHGLWAMYRSRGEPDVDATTIPPSLLACGLMFLSMSGDTLAVFVPFLADTAEGLEPFVLAGAVTSVAMMALIAAMLTRGLDRLAWTSRIVERLLPVLMIIVGLYVLWNTATD